MSIPSVLSRPVGACLAAAALLLWFGAALACDDYAEEQALAAAIAAAKAARPGAVSPAAVGPAAVREPVETAAPASTRP